MSISTHVLDTALGRPARHVFVRLEQVLDGQPTVIATTTTDDDGRSGDLGGPDVSAGTYRLVFDIAAYHQATGQTGFFPEISVTFRLADAAEHYHVPVLVSPYTYSTYRGS
ncbi:MAG: hydroxyisourate hydrolase [Nocardioidaceae bacterium]